MPFLILLLILACSAEKLVGVEQDAGAGPVNYGNSIPDAGPGESADSDAGLVWTFFDAGEPDQDGGDCPWGYSWHPDGGCCKLIYYHGNPNPTAEVCL